MSDNICPFKIGDRIVCDPWQMPATVTKLTERGFEYEYDEPVGLGPKYGVTTGGECYENGFHLWKSYRPRPEPEQTGEGEKIDFAAPWQSLDSAPTDGSKILVLTIEHNNGTADEPFIIKPKIFIASWNPKGNSWVGGKLEPTGSWSLGGGWFQPDEVTHWAPIQGEERHSFTAQVAAYREALEHYASEGNWGDVMFEEGEDWWPKAGYLPDGKGQGSRRAC